MLPVFYKQNFIDTTDYGQTLNDIKNLNWCRPPSGIPGNRTPRNVAVLGDGSTVRLVNGKIAYFYDRQITGDKFAYPMFQTAKNCTAVYNKNKIPNSIGKLIIKLRKLVNEFYGDTAINTKDMFNVAVCNYYTEHQHSINAHRDDERWLELNQKDVHGNLKASIIASLTIYPDDNGSIRDFEIQNDETGIWEKTILENNSILFFSNHNHRAKPLSKKKPNCERFNITFRTVSKGLLGKIGFSNFYRYMSIPREIYVNANNLEKMRYFQQSLEDAFNFMGKLKFDHKIKTHIITSENYTLDRNNNRSKLAILPQYVRPLCSNIHIVR